MSVFSVLLALWFAGAKPQALQTPTSERQVIADVVVTGNRRVRGDAIKYVLQTKRGDVLNPAVVQRDVRAIYALGTIDDVKVNSEDSEKGAIVTFVITERPYIRKVEFMGLKTLTQSDITDKLREKKAALSQQTPYDETKAQRAAQMIKSMLAEKGHQDAKVVVTKDVVPVNDVIVTFNIEEGPKIRIQKISIEGNKVFSDTKVKNAMKLVKEAGPITVFNGKDTYHEGKLQDDLTRIRMLYDDNGYIKINVLDPELETRPVTIHRTLPLVKPPFPWGIPVPFWSKEVNRFFVTIKLEENDQYKIGKVTINGAKVLPAPLIQVALGLREGQIYNGGALRKAVEGLKKQYGTLGYINFTASPSYDFDEEKKLVNMKVDIEEDRRFFVNRIAFSGNTTTRDKVIRRELLLNDGDPFNSQAWDISVLRLNQLGYFEEIKAEEDAEVKPSATEPKVDINLKVKEKGRNSIGFNGGVSGIGGSFLGLSYETNNFLGFGETLSVNVQGGTRQSDFVFSFTEPYFLDRPLSTGFSLYSRNFRYDQAREFFGLDPKDLPSGLGFENRLNFEQKRQGFSVYSSYPLALFQRFTRLGMTYQFENSETNAVNPATQEYFLAVGNQEKASFVTSGGSFSTFRSRKISPTFTYNTVDSPMQPSRGKALTASLEYTGGPLGGNVNYIRPTVEFRYFKPSTRRRNVIAFRTMASYLRGFGGISAPFYERVFMGGDFDIRGFDFRAISPISFLKRMVDKVDPETGRTIKAPFDDIAYIGGDTQAIANFEYRIPLVGPITAAPFFDIGNTWATRTSELIREVVGPDGKITKENAQFLPGTNSGLRASTGIEFQVVMPVINAPFRLIFAYNPLRINNTFYGPTTGLPFGIKEPNHAVKFTIGRTF